MKPFFKLASRHLCLVLLALCAAVVARPLLAATEPPTIITHPQTQTIAAGSPVTFSVTAAGEGDFYYQWQRNGLDIYQATNSTYTIASASTAQEGAAFSVRVSNSVSSVNSNTAKFSITQNRPPAVLISSPIEGALYAAGTILNYAGSATDPEDGELPASAFTWKIAFHHGLHSHPVMPETRGVKSGTFSIPDRGEVSPDVWYRITLIVKDAAGTLGVTTRDVHPRKTLLHLRTEPADLITTIDGQSGTGSRHQSVVGMMREIGAPERQTYRAPASNEWGKVYEFVEWSDGGARVHSVKTPDTERYYIARFREVANQLPTATIIIDPEKSSYTAGETINFEIQASDPDNDTHLLYVWQYAIDGAFSGTGSGRTGKIEIDTRYWRTTRQDVFLTLTAMVRDSTGGWVETSRVLRLQTAPITLQTNPPGLQLFLDYRADSSEPPNAVTAPYSFYSVVGTRRTFYAPFRQQSAAGGMNYEFIGWSGGSYYGSSLSIDTPAEGATPTANYRLMTPEDGSPPVITVAEPTENRSYQGLPSITGRATDDGSGVRRVEVRLYRFSDGLYWGNSTWQADVFDHPIDFSPQSNGLWSLGLPYLRDDKYAVTVSARDGDGNQSTLPAINFFIDTMAPAVTVARPRQNFSYRSLPQASGTATDAGSGVAQVVVRLFRDSDSLWWSGSVWSATNAETPATGLNTWTWSAPALADGKYTLTAAVRDGAGNGSSSVPLSFYIDTTAPVVTVSAPRQNRSYRSLSAASGTAQDIGPGVSQVRGRLYRHSDRTWWNGSVWTTTYAEVVATGTANWTLAFPTLSDSKYTFRATARDYVGNSANSDQIDFFVDNIAPTVSVTTPAANSSYTSIGGASGTARDIGPGVSQVRGRLYRHSDRTWWNGSAWTTTYIELPAVGTTNWTWSFPSLVDGKYTFRAVARDFIGNTTFSAPVDFFQASNAVTVARATASTSVSGLSSASAQASTDSVRLVFVAPLDADAAFDVLKYFVSVDGSTIEVEAIGYDRSRNIVTLSVASEALQAGGTVRVGWRGLNAAGGRVFAGHSDVSVRP